MFTGIEVREYLPVYRYCTGNIYQFTGTQGEYLQVYRGNITGIQGKYLHVYRYTVEIFAGIQGNIYSYTGGILQVYRGNIYRYTGVIFTGKLGYIFTGGIYTGVKREYLLRKGGIFISIHG